MEAQEKAWRWIKETEFPNLYLDVTVDDLWFEFTLEITENNLTYFACHNVLLLFLQEKASFKGLSSFNCKADPVGSLCQTFSYPTHRSPYGSSPLGNGQRIMGKHWNKTLFKKKNQIYVNLSLQAHCSYKTCTHRPWNARVFPIVKSFMDLQWRCVFCSVHFVIVLTDPWNITLFHTHYHN